MEMAGEMAFDADTVLSPEEEKLDAWLLDMTTDYIRKGREDHSFEPARFFYEWDHDVVRSTELFDFVRTMPKGGALHLHSGSSGSVDWVVEEGIWEKGGMVFWGDDETVRCLEQPFNREVVCGEGGGSEVPLLKGMIAFFNDTAAAPKGFRLPEDLKREDAGFMEELRSLLVSGEALKEMDSGEAWEFFDKIFVRVGPATSYKTFYEGYLRNTFEVHAEDNVQHVEIRALCGSNGLGDLWDFDGRVYSGGEVIDVYRKALVDFQKNEGMPNFTMKLIVSSLRVLDVKTIEDDVEEAVQLWLDNKDIIMGFDLVAEEDPNHRTLDYLDVWMKLKEWEERNGVNLPLYFHDGESNDRNNTNVFDAVMLGSKRIGHGTNLYFFPVLYDLIKEQGTVIEVNPLSNQILRYVDNLELHPVNTFLAEGMNVVIAADDPGAFGYVGLSWDYWVSLMGFQLNIKSLKTLARGGLVHSGLEGEELKNALRYWEEEWNKWVQSWEVIARAN